MLTNAEVLELAKEEYGLTDFDRILRVDRPRFKTFLNSLSNENLKNDLYQPLQFRYYDSLGTLKVLYANCDVQYEKKKGKHVWYWNHYGTFDSFPPEEPISKLYLHGQNISNELSSYIPLNTANLNLDSRKPSVIVFWSTGMKEQSQNLIDLVKNYSKSNSANYLYVHTE